MGEWHFVVVVSCGTRNKCMSHGSILHLHQKYQVILGAGFLCIFDVLKSVEK